MNYSRTPSINSLTANIVGGAAAAVPLICKRRHLEFMHPHDKVALVLAITSMACLAIQTTIFGDQTNLSCYIISAFTLIFSLIAIAPIRVSDETGVRIQNGAKSFLEECRLGIYPSKMVETYKLGEHSVMRLRTASDAFLKQQDTFASQGLKLVAFGKVTLSHFGGISKPVIIADFNEGTHIIISAEHDKVTDLIEAVLQSKEENSCDDNDTVSWISYNFVDDNKNEGDKCVGDITKDKVYFNSCGTIDIFDVDVKVDGDHLV